MSESVQYLRVTLRFLDTAMQREFGLPRCICPYIHGSTPLMSRERISRTRLLVIFNVSRYLAIGH